MIIINVRKVLVEFDRKKNCWAENNEFILEDEYTGRDLEEISEYLLQKWNIHTILLKYSEGKYP